ncbi:MAG TPA: type II toxin-antitoxin system CcdA family antitoxin [Micropepsaceae bacterium]|nr:type II toxin-antitoxin system CcdA family antitoxin [Micropepsaceae bacterium]
MTKEMDDPPKPFRHAPGKSRPKRAVNLSVDAEILAAAKALGINLSQVLEDELRKRTRDAREAKWREENRGSVESYNQLIERAGVFGEEFQDWDDSTV